VDVLIERNLAVSVMLEGGWRLPATVIAVTDEHIDMRIASTAHADAVLPGHLQSCKARVAWETRLGTAHRDGMITVRTDGDLRLHAVRQPQHLQRRIHARVPADLVAAIVGDDHRVVTRTLDISVGGMLLSPVSAVVPKQQVRFAIGLGEITVTGVGEVVRTSEEGAPAIRFAGLHGESQREIASFVDRRRRELAEPAAAA